MKIQKQNWKNHEKLKFQQKQQKIKNIREGLNAQLKEKERNNLNNIKIDNIYGRMLQEQDQIDLLREQEERNKIKISRNII